MRVLISFVFLFCFCNILIAQSDLEEQGLNGKVKSISLTVFRSSKKSGEVKLLGKSAESVSSYNKDGYLLNSKQRYHTRTFGTGDWRSSTYELTKRNQCAKAIFFKKEEKIQTVESSYKDDLVAKKVYYDGEGELIGEEIFKYNEDGNVIGKIVMNADLSIRQKIVKTFSKKGKVLTRKEWSGDIFKTSYVYSYPEKNKIRTNNLSEVGDVLSYDIEMYDKEDNLIESTDFDAKGNVTGKHTYEYDKRGNKTLTRVFDADGSEQKYNYMRYEYEYDKKKNWIRQVEYLHNGNSLDVSEREITYY